MSSPGPGLPLRWGILAAGSIAGEFAEGVRASATGVVQGIASRALPRAVQFARDHDVPACYGSYQELLADPEVDVVYVATPHPMHAEWAIKAAQAGKHVLCEKPLTVNGPEAERVLAAAAAADVFLMEAFMYRTHPQTAALVDILRSGRIGEVEAISVSFGYGSGIRREASRATDRSLGGGGILDVGCYAVSVARLVAAGRDIAEPDEVVGLARLDPADRVDHVAMGVLSFPGGILAQISAGITAVLDDAIRVFGTRGRLVVPRPAWLSEHRQAGTSLILVEDSAGTTTVEVVADFGVFSYEADHVARSIPDRQSALIPWAESLANMRTLDRWRRCVGLKYDFERSGPDAP